jgi:hypothetical protein
VFSSQDDPGESVERSPQKNVRQNSKKHSNEYSLNRTKAPQYKRLVNQVYGNRHHENPAHGSPGFTQQFTPMSRPDEERPKVCGISLASGPNPVATGKKRREGRLQEEPKSHWPVRARADFGPETN